jgi:hypothetical protein
MPFDRHAYGPKVAEILELDGGGERLMPLASGTCSCPEARELLQRLTSRDLFPDGRAPEAALSGLWLYFSCLDESHQLSQSIHTVEGSFWHGIMHRQEPDAWNSGYWFQRVGAHAIFPDLRSAAAEILKKNPQAAANFRLGSRWDSMGFIDFCEQARRQPGSRQEQAAMEIQRAEWQLLFDYCARPRTAS